MNYLVLFLLIPLSLADAKFCSEIGNMISDYEKDLSKTKIQKCAEVKGADLLKGHAGLEGQEAFIEQRKCLPLATIESELEKLKGQLSVANGIMKLKQTVDESQRSAAQGNRAAGATFVSSLNTAQSLEILLETSTFDNTPFLQMIKQVPADKRKTQLDLSNIMTELCKNKATNDDNACNPKIFKPSPEAAQEILRMVDTTDVTPQQVEKWQGMIAIEKASAEGEKAKWSFTEMQKELEAAFAAIDNNEVMSRDHLNAIKKLENFRHAPGFSFVENIAALKDQKKAKIMTDSLLVLMGDAKLRAQYETQSKLSVVWANNKNAFSSLKPDEIENCNKAKFLYAEAKKCHALLTTALKDKDDAELKVLLLSIGSNIAYADKMEQTEVSCRDAVKSGPLTEACYGEVGKVPGDIQQQIRQLNILKDKIGAENQDKMKWRNFALLKWADKCAPLPTPMDQCDITDEYGISKNAMLAVRDSLDIAVVFAPKPQAEEEARALCEDEEKKKRKNFEEKLCKLFEKTSNVVQTRNESSVPGADAPQYDHEKDAIRDQYIGATANLMGNVLRTFWSQQQPQMGMMNPYPYNYAPYNGGRPPMGIADSILFNARYYGAYGFYMPTPGYQPGTAFGVNSPLTAYRPMAAAPTRYFSR